jgi:isochorismate pyruvate lyase
MDDDLTRCRSEIDAIDDDILALLVKRFAIVERVIAVKQDLGLPADIPARVDAVLQRVRAKGRKLGLPANLPENLWRHIIAETIAYERRKNLA